MRSQKDLNGSCLPKPPKSGFLRPPCMNRIFPPLSFFPSLFLFSNHSFFKEFCRKSAACPIKYRHDSFPPAPPPTHLWKSEEHNGFTLLVLFSFFIESFIKENRSLNLTSTDLQKAQGIGEMVASLTVVQMKN